MKGWFSPKWKLCHHLLTLMLFQTCVTVLLSSVKHKRRHLNYFFLHTMEVKGLQCCLDPKSLFVSRSRKKVILVEQQESEKTMTDICCIFWLDYFFKCLKICAWFVILKWCFRVQSEHVTNRNVLAVLYYLKLTWWYIHHWHDVSSKWLIIWLNCT